MIKSQDYSRELMTIFFARKKTIVTTTLLFALFSMLVALFWPPIYSAEGIVLVKGKKREKSPESIEIDQSRASLIYEVSREDLAAEMNILSSLNVLESTVLHLSERKLFPNLDTADPESVRSVVAELRENLKLKLLPSSNLIEVSFLHREASVAATILEQLLEEYQQQRFQIYNPDEIETFYRDQALKFRAGIVDLEDQLIVVAQEAATPVPELEIQNNLIIKKDVEQQLVLMQNRTLEKKSHIEGVAQALETGNLQLFSYLPVPSINDMAEKLQSLLVEKANVLSLYRPDSQKGQQIERQIEKTFRTLKSEVTSYLADQRNQFAGLEAQLASQKKRLDALTARNVSLHRYQIENDRIERELDLQKQSYEVFVKRWEESKINSNSEANNFFSINILSRPSASGTPVFPKKAQLIPTGILAGFITGCCFGFIREYFDQTVKTPEDIRLYVDLPTICSIPDLDSSSR